MRNKESEIEYQKSYSLVDRTIAQQLGAAFDRTIRQKTNVCEVTARR
jgi:hypothetical protein